MSRGVCPRNDGFGHAFNRPHGNGYKCQWCGLPEDEHKQLTESESLRAELAASQEKAQGLAQDLGLAKLVLEQKMEQLRVADSYIADLVQQLAAEQLDSQRLRKAARDVVRIGLDCVSVHPCDSNDDTVRARGMSEEMQALHAALSAPVGNGALDAYVAGKIGLDAEDGYYLQDSRNFVGNDMLFWRKGGGYTTSLRDAEVFTQAEAIAQNRSRASDKPWPKKYIDGAWRPAVDVQYVDSVIAAQVTTE